MVFDYQVETSFQSLTKRSLMAFESCVQVKPLIALNCIPDPSTNADKCGKLNKSGNYRSCSALIVDRDTEVTE